MKTKTLTEAERLRALSSLLSESQDSLDPLMDLIGDARFVLIGEASHGTHEFYRTRALLTQRLIVEKGFCSVAAEADFPDAWRVNAYVQHEGEDETAEQALRGFRRFPKWMWRNKDVRDFTEWLRQHNATLPPGRRVGFHGLDLYSLSSSLRAVIDYLEKVDPEAAGRARERYGCFGTHEGGGRNYGYFASQDQDAACEEEAVQQLLELREAAHDYLHRDGHVAEDAYFYATQNARLVQNAERYYRTMYRGSTPSWNLRDTHMAETLEELAAHLGRRFPQVKVAVWAHNSHLGDARATDFGDIGQLNLGQLVRERHGDDARLIGFSTHTGTVTAARNWDQEGERRSVRPSLPESYERLFHESGGGDFLVLLRDNEDAGELLARRRLQRAIGVIYRPETERRSHYFEASLPEQFDAVLHYDQSSAVVPLDVTSGWHVGEAMETYPTGL